MIVAVQPGSEGGCAFGLAAVDADVGPLLEQRAVEALDLAVGLRAVGPGPLRPHAAEAAGGAEQAALVGAAIIGEHGPHLDAELGEPGPRPLQEGGRADGALVREDLAVGEARVVVHGGVDEGVAGAAARRLAPSVGAPAAARGHAPLPAGTGASHQQPCAHDIAPVASDRGVATRRNCGVSVGRDGRVAASHA